jgi:hypothetical protein
MKIKRSQKLIDKKFQLSTTFKILGMILISFLVIIAILSISVMQNSKSLEKYIKELTLVMTAEEKIAKELIDYSKIIDNKTILSQSKKIIQDHDANMEKIKTHIIKLNISIEKNFNLIIIITIIILAIAICLYFYLLNITHRISGPVYVMTKHIQEILDGKAPQFRKLRDKDELKEFYQKFIELSEKINQ